MITLAAMQSMAPIESTKPVNTAKMEMNGFLSSVEKAAYRQARIATRHHEDALDIVQDAMLALVSKYSGKPTAEWKPLFYKILQSRIMDWHRRKQVRGIWNGILPGSNEDDTSGEELGCPEALHAAQPGTPEKDTESSQLLGELTLALQALPIRQQQAFLLRNWQGFSVDETAVIMGCSAGSIKTHSSRAHSRLRELLGDHWK